MNFGSVFDMWLYVEDAGLRSELRVRCDPDTRKRIEDYWHQEIYGKQPVTMIHDSRTVAFENLEMLTRWVWDAMMTRYPAQRLQFRAQWVSRRPNRVRVEVHSMGGHSHYETVDIEGVTRHQAKKLMESYPA
ncbi:hypothetical protein G173_gp039 [Erwinia phage phiEaH2]|uniref:Uncharacterized protein n=1 Tax=Erwinia phage phiEaH2 TaxID=1029988 RepID=J7KDX4_9CAUD|nr:hypothetical protein G173_gp039 [Erwinia phage phiEaH2]AFQ96584.1 hypothetical protein [Erwinia phage phiEaH2]